MSRERLAVWKQSGGKHLCLSCIHCANMRDAEINNTTQDCGYYPCELVNNAFLQQDGDIDPREEFEDNGSGYWVVKCQAYELDKSWNKTEPHNPIKAIETVYKGYKFRSRLEARWAVFFDAMGVPYEYEPEGLVLSDGSWYLPDFFLPEFNCYFEVKRKGLKGMEEGREAERKIRDGQNTGGWAGIICYGDPVDNDLHIFCYDTTDGGGGVYDDDKVTIGVHPVYHIPYLFASDDRRSRTFSATADFSVDIPMETTEYGKYKYSDFVTQQVIQARIKARQARFEKGGGR